VARALLHPAGITFGHSTSKPSVRVHMGDAQSAGTLCPTRQGMLQHQNPQEWASSISKRAGSDLMIFTDELKWKLLCWEWELKQNPFCWLGMESSGGLNLWLFFPCGELSSVLSL